MSRKPGAIHRDVRTTKKHYKAVFLSPHFDDAVFSCGGLIAKLIGNSQPVLVINIFSTQGEDFRHGTLTVGTFRSDEEITVSQFLGYDSINFNQLDSVFRRTSYKSPTKLFTLIDVQDRIELPALSRSLLTLLSQFEYDNIFVPLGVGWHADHVITYLLGRSISDQSRVLYYEDAPYTLLSNLLDCRLNQLSHVPIKERRHAGKALANAYLGANPLKQYSTGLKQVVLTLALEVWFTYIIVKQSKAYRESDALSLEPEIVDISSEMARKISACELYVSQFPEFFGTRENAFDLIGRYCKKADTQPEYWERFWKIVR